MTTANPKALAPLARALRKDIGAHMRLIGKSMQAEVYHLALQKSDAAVALAKYLICSLDSREQAVTFARQVGMPGYINMR